MIGVAIVILKQQYITRMNLPNQQIYSSCSSLLSLTPCSQHADQPNKSCTPHKRVIRSFQCPLYSVGQAGLVWSPFDMLVTDLSEGDSEELWSGSVEPESSAARLARLLLLVAAVVDAGGEEDSRSGSQRVRRGCHFPNLLTVEPTIILTTFDANKIEPEPAPIFF